MALNIKNPDAESAVRALMELTGETQAAAIEKAASERIERLGQHDRDQSIDQLIKQIQRSAREAEPGETAESLYDDNGLPQ